MIELDYRNCLAEEIGSEGISEEKFFSLKKHASGELEKIKKNPPGFMKLPLKFDNARKIKEDVKKYRKFKNLIVVGIGGSALGNITLKNMLSHTYYNQDRSGSFPNIYLLDNADPVWTLELSEIIDLKDTVFNVITKSGSTAETLSNFFFFLEKLKKETKNWKDHLVFTTGQKGFLREFASSNEIKTYPVPEDVGGRYSVLSEVGLFPAAAVGVDIESLLEGAADAEENEHVPITYAALQYYFYKKGKNISVFMPYSKKLESTADWFRQLWAESLGKNEKVGPTPVKAAGTTDQHSQLQLYMEGPKDKVYTFLSTKGTSADIKLNYDSHFLGGKTMRDLFNAELEGTMRALTEAGRPNMNFEIPEIDAYNAGELLYQLEMACAITGYMFGIDPFNQPGVEVGKKLAYEILGSKKEE